MQETEQDVSDTRKSYGEGCIGAHALDLIGDRWALLIARELMLGPKRFGAVKAGIPGIATNMLTRRLAEMEAAGILRRRMAPPPVSAAVYELTEDGLALGPVLTALCRWGARMAGHDPTLPISPTSLMLCMRASLLPEKAAEEDRSAAFSLGDEAFSVEIRGGALHTQRADPPWGEVTFTAGPNDMAAALYGPMPLAMLVAAGRVGFDGDPARGQGFVDCFQLRPPR